MAIVFVSDGVKDTCLKARATAKDFTYKATGNKIKIKQQSIQLQLLVKSVSSSFSKDLSHEAEAKDSTLKVKVKTKDFKIVVEDEDLCSRTPTLVFSLHRPPSNRLILVKCNDTSEA